MLQHSRKPFLRREISVLAAALTAMLTVALVIALSGAPALADAATDTQAAEDSKVIMSKVYTVDKLYRSMKGPQSQQRITLAEGEDPQLVWITGYSAVMVGPDGETQMPQEFMCHSNLDIDVSKHRQSVPVSHAFSSRLFTLSQGQFHVEFPEGFGIPILSSESLGLTTQVLNLNHEDQKFEVRHKVSVDYVRDKDAGGEMIPLFPVGAYGLVSLEEMPLHYGLQDADMEAHGPGCLPGQNAAGHTYTDPLGNEFTGHWVVPPGRQENRTLVNRLMNIPYDTTVHYIAVHLHPFAETLELRDLTADETVFKSDALNYEDKIGLKRVQYFASEEGIPLYRNHDYEMVSVYNNTTDEEQDSMAVMYLYLRDKMFDRDKVVIPEPEPKPQPIAKEGEPVRGVKKLGGDGVKRLGGVKKLGGGEDEKPDLDGSR